MLLQLLLQQRLPNLCLPLQLLQRLMEDKILGQEQIKDGGNFRKELIDTQEILQLLMVKEIMGLIEETLTCQLDHQLTPRIQDLLPSWTALFLQSQFKQFNLHQDQLLFFQQ